MSDRWASEEAACAEFKINEKVVCIDDKFSPERSLKTGNIYTIKGFARNTEGRPCIFLKEFLEGYFLSIRFKLLHVLDKPEPRVVVSPYRLIVVGDDTM